MKRNESVLVYSVTGLLVVILLVAIVFGNDGTVHADGRDQLRTLAELDEAEQPSAGEFTGPMSDPVAEDMGASAFPSGQPAGPAAGQPAAGSADQPGADPAGAAATEPVALVSPGPASEEPPAMATRLAVARLGESRRERGFRVVKVQHGDSFSALVLRWCGSLEPLAVAESLNEELALGRLQPGTEVYLPWVDDEVVLEAHRARATDAAARDRPIAEATQRGLTYEVKSGDKLWDIACARVGAGGASQFIEAVRSLNPDLRDPDRLKPGMKLVLPR